MAKAKDGAQTRNERTDVRSLVLNKQILLYGVVDPYGSLFDDYGSSVRAIDVMASIAELAAESTIVVRINSPGGSVMEGLAIHNALRASGKPIEVHIDAMAASIASVIAMAGDTIVMAENASMMIHDVYGAAAGSADDLRGMAEEIDRETDIIVGIYAKRTGLGEDEVRAMMSAETYMSASDAKDKGFATDIEPAMATAAACKTLNKDQLARVLRLPAPLRAQRSESAAPAASPSRGNEMPQIAKAPAGNDTPAATDTQNIDVGAVRAEATRLERERVATINAAVRTAKLGQDFADELIRDGHTVNKAQELIIAKWSDTQNALDSGVPGHTQIKIVADGLDKWADGAQQGLMLRAGLLTKDERTKAQGNEFVGLTLKELARSYLTLQNIASGHMDSRTMVGRAFTTRNAGPGMHSSSDFTSILANTAHRALLIGYQETEETFPLWTGKGTASDFRPISRVDLNLFPGLDKVEEGAEYKYGTIGDTGVTVQIATYGKMFAITRQAIINDDMTMFQKVPQRMGRAAKRTIGNLVYAILNGNPTMQDGVALFHSSHGNLASSAGAPAVATLSAMRTAMARQKDPDNIAAGLNLKPAFVLLPPELIDGALTVLNSEFTPGDAARTPNSVRNMAQPLSEARLTGTSWFGAADPKMADTIEVTYLDGNEEPFLDQRDGWSVDGTEFKVRMDAGVKALHWRGLAKNAGA